MGTGLSITRRSPYDRDILRLALPALGALVAEPLYVLADTAIVGHLGTRPLAGLAVAGIVLTAAFSVFNFLAYSTTAAVARRVGAGDRRAAAALGVDGAWLGLALGLGLAALGLLLAPTIVSAMGASDRVQPYALTYLRISALGAPAYLVMLAGAGYLRGVQDTRTTLVVAVAANVVNVVLEVLLVYGLHLGIAGSAWGTVVAQVGAAVVYATLIVRAARRAGAPPWPDRAGVRTVAVVGGPLVVRTASLLAALVVATNLAARTGDDAVAAHQIAFQVMLFLALALDAVAIAAQAMVGRLLGADDAAGARAASDRMLQWGIALGLGVAVLVAASSPVLVRVFSDGGDVRHLATLALLVVALLQPLGAVVFVLDGVLIGAGDQRYLAAAMLAATLGVFAPAAVTVALVGGGLMAVWGALALWLVARLVGLGHRYRQTAWQVTGAAIP